MGITQVFRKTQEPILDKHNQAQASATSEQESVRSGAGTMSPEQWLFYTQLSQHLNSGATSPASTTHSGGWGYVTPDHSQGLVQYHAKHSNYRSYESTQAFERDDLPLAVVRTQLTSGSVPVNTTTYKSGPKIRRSSSSATHISRSSSIGTVVRQSSYTLPSISEVVENSFSHFINNVPKAQSLLPAAPIVRAKTLPKNSRTSSFGFQTGDFRMPGGKGKQPIVAVRSIASPQEENDIHMSTLARPTPSQLGTVNYSTPHAANQTPNGVSFSRHLPVTEPTFNTARYTNSRPAAGNQPTTCLIDFVQGAPIPQECPNEPDVLQQQNTESSRLVSRNKNQCILLRLLRRMKLFKDRIEPESKRKRERVAEEHMLEARLNYMDEMSDATDRRTLTRQVVRIEAGKK
ncbi:hypothetical protein CBER1_07918 [Cercospora berteroae]|uniref:Uncharacterized protein n=1 Tax=Cercospora berteroae TaxID=357750 RepID=A0A2S6BUD3_9PEZI|nr:hypothetical protein CBER1_07918 [Cercospora berteroae]